MARVRRVIRKTERSGQDGFEYQFWPVLVSLFVLGGFLFGVILVYLDGHPMYWPSLIMLPVVIGGLIVTLKFISNRLAKRSSQMALIISVVLHVAIIIICVENEIRSEREERDPEMMTLKIPKTITVPNYTRPEEQTEREVEKLVETEQVQPQPDIVEKQEPEPPKTPERPPQPLPVPEPQNTPQPQVTKKRETTESVPRPAEQQSQLSKQETRQTARSGVKADVPQQNESQTSAQADAQVQAQKQPTADQQITKRDVSQPPSTDTSAPTVQINKRTNEPTPQPDAVAAPTIPRQIDNNAPSPRTSVETPNQPSQPKKTPDQPTPNNTAATKQTTTSPQHERSTVEPTPQPPTNVASNPTRRQSEAPQQPQLAQADNATPTDRPRQTTRPNTATSADVVTPSRSPAPTPAQPAAIAKTTSPTKATADAPQVSKVSPENVPQTPTTQTAASLNRRPSQDAPTTTSTADARTSVARQSDSSATTPNTSARVSDATAPSPQPATNAIASNLAPSSTPAAKQTAADNPVTRASTQPATADAPSPTTPTTGAAERRRPDAQPDQATATASVSVPRPRTTDAMPSVSTTVNDVTANQAPSQSSSPTPQPSTSTVAQQPTSSPIASRSQTSLDAPSLSPSTQTARPSTQRAQSADRPSINPQANPSPSPARSQSLAQAAVSPTSVESPATSQSATGSGQPNAQPARMAVNKAAAGTAGAGKSQNLDRAMPATGAALMASDSAARERATQLAEGPAFAPSQQSQIRRSVADQQAPGATMTSTKAEIATRTGADQPTQINATASASTIQANSNADAGQISAAKGNVQVDLGPTKIMEVNEDTTGRTAGGGQPALNSESQADQIARTNVGGSPQLALATPTQADEAMAPMATGGGQPNTPEVNLDTASAVRTEAGGGQPVSGGPSADVAKGPSSEVSTADQVAQLAISRAESAEAADGDPAQGGGDPDLDEEEKQRRLARQAAGGAPQLALSAPTVADLPMSPSGEPGGGGQPAAAAAQLDGTEVARAETGGGAPAATASATSADSGPAADAGGGELVGAVKIGRAESADSQPGDPLTGGGTASPARSAAAPTFAASTKADTVAIADGGSMAGDPSLNPVDAQGLEAARLAGGSTGPTVSGPVGGIAGQTAAAATSGMIAGAAAGTRPSSGSGPALASADNVGAPLKKADAGSLPSGALAATDIELPVGSPGDMVADAGTLAGANKGTINRQSEGGIIANVAAVEGPGGIGKEFSPTAGVNSRRAREDSPELKLASRARFSRSDPGGTLGTSTAAVIPSEAFRGRAGEGGPQTEPSVELGLVYLQRQQAADGSWSLSRFNSGGRGNAQERVALDSDTAATGLALLAFQGAGYHHKEYQYAETVRQGVYWLIRNQQENGDLYVTADDESNRSVWLYSHSIAALALCEAYGMTQDPELREPAQKAVDFIVASQNEKQGGWRYSPNRGADTSVTGWMFMALHSGDLANLDVPAETYEGIEKWLNLAQESKTDSHLYRYNPYAPDDQSHGREASKTMTSVGLLMRLYTGWKRTDEGMIKGAQYLKQNLPEMGNDTRYAFSERDTYYWYYATQVMGHMGGDYFEQWYTKRLHPILMDTQTKTGPLAGSWDPLYPVPDRWGPHAGRIYVTAMNLLSLEVRYRLLPLYENTVKVTP